MKHLKLFFALFAMLALGVGNAWGADCDYSDDFSTVNVNTSYSARTTTAGWSATNTAVENYTYNSKSYRAFKMNGKKGGLGKITSPLFTDGCSAISFVYGQAHKDAIKFDVKIYDKNNVELFSKSYSASKPSAAPTAGVLVEETITGVEGDFYVVFANTSTSTSTSNGYRVSIMNVCITSAGSGSGETVVSVPTFSVPEGTFYSPINVELSCSTADAEIYYTLDGTTPSSTSEKYTTAIAISETTTVKAIAVKDGLTDSEVVTATYTKGETVTSYDIDFETNALEAYVNWDFSNITIANTISAKVGTYYGNTSGKGSASIKTKEKIQYPGILTFHTSKESNNTTASSWKVQVSETGTSWTEVASFDATTGNKGTWTERTADLSNYENVYVQISYGSSTAVRAIDEISLAQGVAPVKYTLNITTPTNGTLVVNEGETEVTSGATFKKGTTLTITATPSTGYKLDGVTVVDESSNNVTADVYADGVLTMPAYNVTISAAFSVNEKPDATLTLSKNGITEDITGHKQDDVIILPSITSDCVKEFVGWSADENCTTEPEYEAGDEYTLAATAQTLYAVYATVQGGGEATSEDLFENNGTYNSTAGTITWELTNVVSILQEKSNASSSVADYVKDPRWYKDHLITITPSANIKEIVVKAQSNDYATALASSTYTNATATANSDVVTITPTDGNEKITIKMGAQARLYTLTVTYASAATYSDYSTTCAAAPKAEVNPTSVTATAAGGSGKVEVTYENVNTANVSVALFNDAACTEAFTAGWLTASIVADKNITYTVAENTTYTERKAYIQLTAPETTGATDPDMVVIPVTQAAKDKVFASLAELVAADLTAGDEVTVTLNNDVIKEFYIYSSKRCGVVFDVQKDGKDIKIYFNSQTTIDDWAVGGKLSGTLTNVKWTTYSSAWQLAPANTWAWANLTYTEPKAVSTVVVSGAPTKTTYVDGEAFDPAGLTVTVNYNDATTEINPTGVTFTVTPTTLVKGQTSVSVTATYNSVTSVAYEVTGLTVNDIPTKTVAEFIAAEGGRCYLEGIVSGLTEGNSMKYGNFDLTDASGTIYVYGCLNASGEKEKFAELGVKNGDKIKVIADEYELYGGTKDEAKNVQYVSHVSAASITISDITMEVGETKTIAAIVVPAEAEVTYTIKENAANAISLSSNSITALAEGTATITATVAEGATYLGNSFDFTVTVGPKTESDEVVILAELDGKWYAMKGAVPTGKSNQLDALEVTYLNGTLYNVAESDKASITWTRSVVDGKATFANNGKYLKGDTDTDLTLSASVDDKCKWTWDDENGYYTTNTSGTIRTFLYRNGYNFKNYGVSQAGKEDANGNYSSLPVVTAPVYATGDITYTRNVTNKYGTICLPYASASTSGAYFYRVVGKETGKVYLESVDALEAGIPYIFEKTANTIMVTCQGEAVAEASSANGLIGTFTDNTEVAVGNYILKDNAIRECTAICWVNAYRAYLDMDAVIGGAPVQMPGRRYIGMSVQGENEATGFENITAPEGQVIKAIVNGQLVIIRGGEMYNVQGQKL